MYVNLERQKLHGCRKIKLELIKVMSDKIYCICIEKYICGSKFEKGTNYKGLLEPYCEG